MNIIALLGIRRIWGGVAMASDRGRRLKLRWWWKPSRSSLKVYETVEDLSRTFPGIAPMSTEYLNLYKVIVN